MLDITWYSVVIVVYIDVYILNIYILNSTASRYAHVRNNGLCETDDVYAYRHVRRTLL